MAPSTKITTCCYCGARAALVLRGDVRHELACGNCGAPLHDLKGLKADKSERGAYSRQAFRGAAPAQFKSPSKKKRKKSKRKKLFSEIFDVVEDLFD